LTWKLTFLASVATNMYVATKDADFAVGMMESYIKLMFDEPFISSEELSGSVTAYFNDDITLTLDFDEKASHISLADNKVVGTPIYSGRRLRTFSDLQAYAHIREGLTGVVKNSAEEIPNDKIESEVEFIKAMGNVYSFEDIMTAEMVLTFIKDYFGSPANVDAVNDLLKIKGEFMETSRFKPEDPIKTIAIDPRDGVLKFKTKSGNTFKATEMSDGEQSLLYLVILSSIGERS